MTDNQENKLRMYFTVSAICDCNSEIWQDNEVFVADYHRFQSKIPLIEKYRDLMKIENIISGSIKSFDRIELEEMAFYLSGKIQLYAKEIGNQSLYAEVHNNRDNLGNATDIELIEICNALADQASAGLPYLASYGITTESIASLQQQASMYFVNMNRAKSSHLKTKSVEERLRKLFKDCDDLLRNKLDNDIEFYKNSDPEFYGQYKTARIVIGLEPSTMIEIRKMVSAIN
ncbi:MAG TPA: hypothetical protein VIH57_12650 [Bacteroidales bacterium]